MSGLKKRMNTNHIFKLLTYLRCKYIKEHPKYISCGNPDGDNQMAIIVYKNTLYVENHTRYDFQTYKIKDIITLVEFIEQVTYYKALQIICNVCGFDYYDIENSEKSSLFQIINTIKTSQFTNKQGFKILDDKILSGYENMPTLKWIEEGISYEAQKKFNIGFDLESERILIPIFDEIGNIVGIKGRSLKDDVPNKYIYLYECPKTIVLFGLYQNYSNIKAKDCVIVVESEKSVIKLYGYGFRNVVAIGGKTPSQIQIEKLLRLGVKNIIFALDKDVKSRDIENICKKFNVGFEFLTIEYLYDSLDFMKEKDSPSDDMNTFKLLFNKFRYRYVPV